LETGILNILTEHMTYLKKGNIKCMHTCFKVDVSGLQLFLEE